MTGIFRENMDISSWITIASIIVLSMFWFLDQVDKGKLYLTDNLFGSLFRFVLCISVLAILFIIFELERTGACMITLALSIIFLITLTILLPYGFLEGKWKKIGNILAQKIHEGIENEAYFFED